MSELTYHDPETKTVHVLECQPGASDILEVRDEKGRLIYIRVSIGTNPLLLSDEPVIIEE